MKLSLVLPNNYQSSEILQDDDLKIFSREEKKNASNHSITVITLDINPSFDAQKITQCYEALKKILKCLLIDFITAVKEQDIVKYAQASAELSGFNFYVRDFCTILNNAPAGSDKDLAVTKVGKLAEFKTVNKLFSIFPGKDITDPTLSKTDADSLEILNKKLISLRDILPDNESPDTLYKLEVLTGPIGFSKEAASYLENEAKLAYNDKRKTDSNLPLWKDAITQLEATPVNSETSNCIFSETILKKDILPHYHETLLPLKEHIKELLECKDPDKLPLILMNISDAYHLQDHLSLSLIAKNFNFDYLDYKEKHKLRQICDVFRAALENVDQKSALTTEYKTELITSLEFIQNATQCVQNKIDNTLSKPVLILTEVFNEKIHALDALSQSITSYQKSCETNKPREKIATQDNPSLNKREIASMLNDQLEKKDTTVKQKVTEMGKIIHTNTDEILTSRQPKTVINSFLRCCIKAGNALLGVWHIRNPLVRDAHWARMKDTANCVHGATLVNHFNHHTKELGINAPSFRA